MQLSHLVIPEIWMNRHSWGGNVKPSNVVKSTWFNSNQMIWLLYSQPVILRVYMQGTYKIYCNLLWMDLTKDESSQIESRLDEGLSVSSSSANWLPAVLRFKNKEGSVAHALWFPVRWCTFQLLLSWFVHVVIFLFAHAPYLLVC